MRKILLLIPIFLMAATQGIGALVKGSLAVGTSKEDIGCFDLIIFVHIINTDSNILHIPTEGYSYNIKPDRNANKTIIVATIDMAKSILGYKMPPSESDLKIVKLHTNESAVIIIKYKLPTDEITDGYDVTLKLDNDMAKRFRYDAGVYNCYVKLPDKSINRKSNGMNRQDR